MGEGKGRAEERRGVCGLSYCAAEPLCLCPSLALGAPRRYASTCQTVGMNAGYFASFTVFLALNDPSFCARWLPRWSAHGRGAPSGMASAAVVPFLAPKSCQHAWSARHAAAPGRAVGRVV